LNFPSGRLSARALLRFELPWFWIISVATMQGVHIVVMTQMQVHRPP
jgi:hypothetical protein